MKDEIFIQYLEPKRLNVSSENQQQNESGSITNKNVEKDSYINSETKSLEVIREQAIHQQKFDRKKLFFVGYVVFCALFIEEGISNYHKLEGLWLQYMRGLTFLLSLSLASCCVHQYEQMYGFLEETKNSKKKHVLQFFTNAKKNFIEHMVIPVKDKFLQSGIGKKYLELLNSMLTFRRQTRKKIVTYLDKLIADLDAKEEAKAKELAEKEKQQLQSEKAEIIEKSKQENLIFPKINNNHLSGVDNEKQPLLLNHQSLKATYGTDSSVSHSNALPSLMLDETDKIAITRKKGFDFFNAIAIPTLSMDIQARLNIVVISTLVVTVIGSGALSFLDAEHKNQALIFAILFIFIGVGAGMLISKQCFKNDNQKEKEQGQTANLTIA